MMRFFQAVSTNVCRHGAAAGAVSLKKPHDIITLRFSEVVKGHANYVKNSNRYTTSIRAIGNINLVVIFLIDR